MWHDERSTEKDMRREGLLLGYSSLNNMLQCAYYLTYYHFLSNLM